MYILTPQLQGIRRHPGISHTLPCSTMLLRFCQMPAADCCGPRHLCPCLALWAFGHCMAWAGKEGGWEVCAALYLQHRRPHLPPVRYAAGGSLKMPSRQTIIKRAKESQAPAVYSFLPFFLSVLAPFPPEVQARLPGAPSRFPRAQEGCWSTLCAAGS